MTRTSNEKIRNSDCKLINQIRQQTKTGIIKFYYTITSWKCDHCNAKKKIGISSGCWYIDHQPVPMKLIEYIGCFNHSLFHIKNEWSCSQDVSQIKKENWTKKQNTLSETDL